MGWGGLEGISFSWRGPSRQGGGGGGDPGVSVARGTPLPREIPNLVLSGLVTEGVDHAVNIDDFWKGKEVMWT